MTTTGAVTSDLAYQDPDERWMRLALQEARAAYDAGEVPVGAVIVADDRILGRGHNLVERLRDPSAHAEMLALTAATNALNSKYLHGCTLYVTLEPCPMCAAALRWAQISRVVYGASDAKNGYRRWETGSESFLHPRTVCTHGLLAEPCAALMVDFFRARR